MAGVGRTPHEPPRVRLDTSILTPEELQAFLRLYEELMVVVVTANNALLAKLVDCPDTTNARVDIFNAWSTALNDIHAAHAKALEKVVAGEWTRH